ncbi:unnamed protein product [Candida verbasci]|uniref:Golgi SNAP receptor complex member 1 n=1 Tax=Candida verbasci TaxID=1227364 RepID=A0A9W4XCA9_9ASCO|nr:unnamed protein product [Candida verbasci]
MSSSTFSQIRQQIINYEKGTESTLSKYSQIDPIDDETETTTKIEELLEKREGLISKLNRIHETDPSLSTSKLQQLSRHKEILNDHKLQYVKITDKLNEERNKNNLLNNIHSDLNKRREREREINGNDYINEESQRVDSLNSFADRLLNNAYLTRDELLNQRQFLNNASNSMLSMLQQVPGLNVLISKINSRRKRDTLIIATVISICIVLLFFV